MTIAPFRLNPYVLSQIVWQDLFADIDLEIDRFRASLTTLWDACERSRPGMAYNTGSISLASGFALYALARRYAPAVTFEVGTFIGKSSVAIAAGTEAGGRADAVVYTCDASNDFLLSYPGSTRIVGFPRQTSTQALQELAQRAVQADLLHIDGRLDAADLQLVQRLIRPQVVIALDDFEGMEKGVANLSLLRPQPWLAGHVLVYPPAPELLARYGVHSRSTTAVMLPAAHFIFSPQ